MKNPFSSFFSTLSELLTNPSSYRAYPDYSNGQIARFLLISLLCLSGLKAVEMTTRQLPLLKSRVNQALTEFTNHYPEELKVSWSNNQLQLTPAQAYTLYFPSFVDRSTWELPNWLGYYSADLTTNPTTNPTAASISAVFVANPNTLFVEESDQNWSELAWSDIFGSETSWSLTKSELFGKVQSVISDPQLWQSLYLGAIASSLPITLLTLLWHWLAQWLITYLIFVKLYRVKLTGPALAKLLLPICVVALGVEFLAYILYGFTPLPLFVITFWIILFSVSQELFFKPQL